MNEYSAYNPFLLRRKMFTETVKSVYNDLTKLPSRELFIDSIQVLRFGGSGKRIYWKNVFVMTIGN